MVHQTLLVFECSFFFSFEGLYTLNIALVSLLFTHTPKKITTVAGLKDRNERTLLL